MIFLPFCHDSTLMKRKTIGEQHEEEDMMVLTKQRMRREQRALMAATVRAVKSLSITSCRLHDILEDFCSDCPTPYELHSRFICLECQV